MLLLFISHMVSETPVVLLFLMKTLVSMMTQTLTPMSGRISLYMMLSYCNMLMLHIVHALPLRGIVLTVHLLLKDSALMSPSLILMGDLLLVPAHLPVVIPTLTSMITAVTQVTSMSTARRSNSGYNVCIRLLKKKKKKRRKGNVNLWFESNNSLLNYTHICLFLLPQACILGCCDCHIAIL
jgi:hypothetical protein